MKELKLSNYCEISPAYQTFSGGLSLPLATALCLFLGFTGTLWLLIPPLLPELHQFCCHLLFEGSEASFPLVLFGHRWELMAIESPTDSVLLNGALFVSAAVALVFSMKNRTLQPARLAVGYLSFFTLLAVVLEYFFPFSPDTIFSLYLQAQATLWLATPLLLNLALLPIPLSPVSKFVLNGSIITTWILLTAIRYFVLLVAVKLGLNVLIPLLLLTLGPWIDIYAIISLYGWIVSKAPLHHNPQVGL